MPLTLRVGVLMVDVGKVRVAVPQPLVAVLVCVGLGAVPFCPVLVLMMRIVRVCMTVNQRLVNVLMLMVLGQMQPNTARHARSRNPERPADRLSIEHNRERAADEGRRCEIGAGASGPQVAKREDEQYQTHAVTEESQNKRRRHLRGGQ